MSTISERIIQLVEEKEKGNKSAFARKMNVTPAYITKLAKNANDVPSDRFLFSVCREYGCSIEWLRDGVGDPFLPKSREEQIAEFVTSAMQRTPEEERRELIEKIQSLTDAEIILFAEIIKRIK